jgi:mannose-1-phosphate guanylyltransferase
MRHAVILAGGGGTRLWPASRNRRPKQFLPLGTDPDEPLLAATARRLDADVTWVVTGADYAAAVAHILPAARVVVEPLARNTAAAIGLAARTIAATDPDAVVGVFPSDQHVADEAGFRAAAARAYRIAAAEDALVVLGIHPTRPETGFGYLAPDGPGPDGSVRVARFVEKPDAATAARYVADGYLWNAGIFFFRAARILREIDHHLPALAAALADGDWTALPPVSLDYGVMEKAAGILAVRGDFGWNDVGSWTALADIRPADAAGNVTQGDVVAHDATRNIAIADPGRVVALVGVSDLVVVQAGDAVLVLPRERAQDVREIVRLLRERGLDRFL